MCIITNIAMYIFITNVRIYSIEHFLHNNYLFVGVRYMQFKLAALLFYLPLKCYFLFCVYLFICHYIARIKWECNSMKCNTNVNSLPGRHLVIPRCFCFFEIGPLDFFKI